jgi:acyl phosphate:glycerol-3-phosphate acyltransferase
MVTPVLIAAVVGYFLGALPFGYLVARAKGINIFEHGSKNPGATNVRRVLGKGPGNLVFFLDALKGAVAAGWPLMLATLAKSRLPDAEFEGGYVAVGGLAVIDVTYDLVSAVAGLIGALIGHSFSCFTGFKGGKGVATATGGFLVLMPLVLLVGAAVWALTFYSTRYVSLASMLAATTLPIAGFFLREQRLLVGLGVVIALFVIIRHRANIARLMNGTESKFVKKPAAAAAADASKS